MTDPIPPKRTFPGAREEAETAAQTTLSPQTMDPAYKLAFQDMDFLLREDLRPVRFQLELLKPELLLDQAKIASTFVFYGSARIPEPGKADALIAAAAMGDPNASIPTPQPVHYRPMFGAFGGGLRTSVTFVSRAALDNPAVAGLGLRRPLEAVKDTRAVGKKDMVHNAAMPKIDVDPETYEVRADGEILTCEPARELPLAQRYFLF